MRFISFSFLNVNDLTSISSFLNFPSLSIALPLSFSVCLSHSLFLCLPLSLSPFLCLSVSLPLSFSLTFSIRYTGTGLPLPCRGGYYCGDHTGLPTGQCHPGYYCIGGLSSPTPVHVSQSPYINSKNGNFVILFTFFLCWFLLMEPCSPTPSLIRPSSLSLYLYQSLSTSISLSLSLSIPPYLSPSLSLPLFLALSLNLSFSVSLCVSPWTLFSPIFQFGQYRYHSRCTIILFWSAMSVLLGTIVAWGPFTPNPVHPGRTLMRQKMNW